MSAAKYDIEVDLGAPGTSHRHMVEMIGPNKTVLDVGCATGYLAKALRSFGNTVTGVEYDPEAADRARAFADRVVVADLDHVDLRQAFDGEKFDVVVFGDVLEHLRDPLPPLQQARSLLAPGGYIVISIPNIAHGDVRMSLLLGRFPYRNLGLLDSTHLRFFTRANLRGLLEDAGFAAIEVRTTTAPLFGTELGVDRTEVDPAVVQLISDDPDALVYQFVLTAVPRDATTIAAETAWEAQEGAAKLAEMTARCTDLEAEQARAQAELTRAQDDLILAQETIVGLQAHVDELTARAELVTPAERELNALMATRTLRTRSAALRMLRRA